MDEGCVRVLGGGRQAGRRAGRQAGKHMAGSARTRAPPRPSSLCCLGLARHEVHAVHHKHHAPRALHVRVKPGPRGGGGVGVGRGQQGGRVQLQQLVKCKPGRRAAGTDCPPHSAPGPQAWVARDVHQGHRAHPGLRAASSGRVSALSSCRWAPSPTLSQPAPLAASLGRLPPSTPPSPPPPASLHPFPPRTHTFSWASGPSAAFSCMDATVPCCPPPCVSWWNSVVFPASQGPTNSTALPLGPPSHSLSRAGGEQGF